MPDARRALLDRLIDHAPLFPPASMSVPDAALEDRHARRSSHAWMLGRFVCPASKVAALGEEMPWERAPGLSVVLDGAADADLESWAAAVADDMDAVRAARAGGAPVEAVEVRLPAPLPEPRLILRGRAPLRDLGVEAYFELRLSEGWRDAVPAAIGALSAVDGRVKLRCGGDQPGAVPSVEQVALVIAACRQAGVAFKATAGLHQPLRHMEHGSGAAQHGFLNLLAASVLAHAHEARPARLERVLCATDPSELAVGADGIDADGLRADAHQIAAARESLFSGYGSCSWREPVDGLRALGVLAA